jgi:hypothetical protein
MRAINFAIVAAVLVATPAMAQGVVQSPVPPAYAVPDTTGTVIVPNRPVGGVPETTVESTIDSAKGGNAAMPSRMAPNLGTTSGGPTE